jgi:hypothetical protein
MKTSLINIRLANQFNQFLPVTDNLSESLRAMLQNAMANDLVPASFSKVRGEASSPVSIRVSDDLAMWIASFEGSKTATITGLIVASMAKPKAKVKSKKTKA